MTLAPAVIVATAFAFASAMGFGMSYQRSVNATFLILGGPVHFAVLPIITMAISLRIGNPIAAGLVSMVFLSYIPSLLTAPFFRMFGFSNSANSLFFYFPFLIMPVVIQIGMAMWASRYLSRNLKERCAS